MVGCEAPKPPKPVPLVAVAAEPKIDLLCAEACPKRLAVAGALLAAAAEPPNSSGLLAQGK